MSHSSIGTPVIHGNRSAAAASLFYELSISVDTDVSDTTQLT